MAEFFRPANNEVRRRRGALRIVDTYVVVNKPYSTWTKLFMTTGGEWFLEEMYRPILANKPIKMVHISREDALKLIDESIDQFPPPITEYPS